MFSKDISPAVEPGAGTVIITVDVTLVTFLITLPLYFGFDPGGPEFQFTHERSWLGPLGAKLSFGVDGISVLLIVLTAWGPCE